MKKKFRTKIIKNRKCKDMLFINNNSYIISEKVLSLECVKNAKNIMLYLDFNNEVKTNNLIVQLLKLNKIVSSPITIKNERKIIPYQITNLDEGIVVGAYGIREPNPKYSLEINPYDIDIVIVPAVAYDKNCYRLGYGGGFYDRFLSKLRYDTITIGIAFDFQIFENIPKEKHDAQLNYVITETKILTPSLK